jgi:hypothetical protein
MRLRTALPLSLAGLFLLAILATFALAVADLRGDATTRLLWMWAGRIYTGTCAMLPLLTVAGLCLGIYEGWRWLHHHTPLVYHHAGQLPASADPRVRLIADHRNERAEVAQAIFNGRVDRATGTGMRALLNPRPDEEILQLPAPTTTELTAEDVIQPDPQRRPDTFVVGQKGSGKTNVLRYIINQYQEALPAAKFLVLSTIASNWAGIDAVTQPEAIYQAVMDLRTEINTRDQAMKAQNVPDFFRWSAAPPLIVVILDEAEAVFDALRIEGQRTAREFAGTLRIVVNTGRNFGMLFVVGTQTARADVLDPAMLRNAGTLLMMRMDSATAARFAVYGREVTDVLPTMPAGRAYNPQQSGYVTFPFVPALRLPQSATLCRPELRLQASDAPLLLPADAEADGLGADDLPDGVTTGTRYTVQTHGGGRSQYTGIAYRVPGQSEALIDYDENLHRNIWTALQTGSSLKGAQKRAGMDYVGGTGFYLVRQVQELGQQHRLPWERT